MMRRLRWILLLCLSSPAFADDSIVLHGFGTLGISCFSDNNADFFYNNLPNGPGRSRHCDTGLDSVLGVQLDATLADTLSIVVQVTSEHTALNNYNPQFSLAHLNWQASEALMIRLGRVSNPLFLNSDYRLVHFSLPTVRPPTELYGLSPFYTMDGVDAFYHDTLHGWHIEYYAAYQRSNTPIPLSNSTEVDTAKNRDILTLSTSAERGPWLYKIGYSQGKVSYATGPSDAIFSALSTLNPVNYPGAAALSDQLDMLDTPYHIYTAAARYEESNWLLQTEIGQRTFDKSYFRDSNAGYVTAGYHIGTWMPYATLARRKSSGPESDSRAGPLAAQVAGLLATTRYDQSSLMLGVSREIGKSAVIKGQIQWLQPDQGSSGVSLGNFSPVFNHANPPFDRLISVNLDFVF